MFNFFEKVFFGFCLAGMCILLSAPYFIYKGAERKRDLYTECITTDYDKFECYSMIYGDK